MFGWYTRVGAEQSIVNYAVDGQWTSFEASEYLVWNVEVCEHGLYVIEIFQGVHQTEDLRGHRGIHGDFIDQRLRLGDQVGRRRV